MKLTGPAASIIVALIVVAGVLFGTGALAPAVHTYAKVNFDGGYMLLGVIKREEIFSNVDVTYDGRSIFSGTFEEVIPQIEKSIDKTLNPDPTWNTGVTVKANAGVQWTGSDGNFKLTTDQLEKTSLYSAPLKPLVVIEELKALEAKAKQDRTKNAQQALTFGPPPLEPSWITRLAAAVR